MPPLPFAQFAPLDYYRTVYAALHHQSVEFAEDRKGLVYHLGQGLNIRPFQACDRKVSHFCF